MFVRRVAGGLLALWAFAQPAAAQVVTTDESSYTTDDVAVVDYAFLSGTTLQTFIAIARTDMADDVYSWWLGAPFAVNGTVVFDHLPVGEHLEIRVYKDNGLEILVRSAEFSVEYGPGITPDVEADQAIYDPAEEMTFSWAGAPGYFHDWIGVSLAGSAPNSYIGFAYTEGDYEGDVTWSAMDHTAGVELLPPGDFEVRGYVNDLFDVFASETFSVELPADWTSTVAADRTLYTPSDPVEVCWTGAPGNPLDWVGIAKRALSPIELYSYVGIDGTPTWAYTDGLVEGCRTFETEKVLGQYAARAFMDNTYAAFANQDLFTVNFEPVNPAVPLAGSVSPDLLSYYSGQPIVATFSGLTGELTDVLAVMDATEAPDDPNAVVWWTYLDGSDSGVETILEVLDEGTYVLRALHADSFSLLAESAAFDVVYDAELAPAVFSLPHCIAPGTPSLYVAYENVSLGTEAWVGIFEAGSPADAFSEVWAYVGSSPSGHGDFAVDHLLEGEYEIRLLNAARKIAASSPLTVSAACPVASVSVDKTWYTVGDLIEVSFSGLLGHPHENVGTLLSGLDPTTGLYSEVASTFSQPSGILELVAEVGTYEVHAFLDPDGTSLATSSTFPVCRVGEVPDCEFDCVPDYLIPPFACLNDTGSPPVFGGSLRINEVLADPPNVIGDANCDGVTDFADDEFVELVNDSALWVNLSLATISDSFGPRHVFPTGASLAPGETVVVFGGGTPTFDGSLPMSWCATLPIGASAETASTGTLGLSNTGDIVTVADGDGNVLDTRTYGSDANFDQSIVLKPEVTGASMVLHTTMPSAVSAFSPGTRAAGGSFQDSAPDTSDPGGSSAGGLINEVLADPDAVLGDANCDGVVHTSDDEFVEIVNHTTEVVDLTGSRLEDGFGPRHVFGAGSELSPGDAIVVFGGGSPSFDGDAFKDWCVPLPAGVTAVVASTGSLGLSNAGDVISLIDTHDVVIDTTAWDGTGGEDESLTRSPELLASSPFIKHLLMEDATTSQSPGRRAALGTFLDAPPDTSDTGDGGGGGPIDPPVVDTSYLQAIINEVLADPDAALGDANCDGILSTTEDEFVEIANPGPDPMDLSLVVLSDGALPRHQFAPGTIVPVNGAVVVFAGGTPTFDGSGAGAWCDAPSAGVTFETASTGLLGLTNTGDTVTLMFESTTIDSVTWGSEGGQNASLVRQPEIDTDADLFDHGDLVGSLGAQSPGRFFDGTQFDGTGGPEPVIGGVAVINELLADPHATEGDANCDGIVSTTNDEFIEIVNAGDDDLTLTGATISDAISVRHTFGALVLGPGDAVVVFGSGTPSFGKELSTSVWCHALPQGTTAIVSSTATVALNNTGDTVTLKDSGGVVLDTVVYGSEGAADTSLVRSPDLDGATFVQHNSVAAARWSPGRAKDNVTPFSGDAWAHAVTIDGSVADWFDFDERFDTTQGGTTGTWATWDEDKLYLAVKNSDVQFGGNQHWVVIYLGDDEPGTMTGITHNTQQPGLPFEARYVIRWKADDSYQSLLTWTGSAWAESAFYLGTNGSLEAEHNVNQVVEFQLDRAALGLGSVIGVHVSWVYEGSFFESTYSGSPGSSFVNGAYDPNFSDYLALDLSSSLWPVTQTGP